MAAPFTLDSMTRKQCVAFGCTLQLRKAAAKEGWRISYHKFPRDHRVREAWLKNLKQSGSEITSHASICSLHFKPTDFVMDQQLMNKMGIFYKRRLHKDAVPTVFLVAPETEDPEQTKDIEIVSPDLPMQSLSSEENYGKNTQSVSSNKISARDCDLNAVGVQGNSKSAGIGEHLFTASTATSSKNRSGSTEGGRDQATSTFQYEGKVDPEITVVKTESKENERKKIFTMVGLSPNLDLSTSDNSSVEFPMGGYGSTKATPAKEKKTTQKPLTVVSSGKLQFSCKQCDASFDEELQLELHELVHTGQKPFQCKQCYKMFARKSQLSDHETVHIGEKPQVCTYCGKAYRILSHLQEHLKSHTARQPYKCTYCNKVFIEEYQIRAHLKLHTDGPDAPIRVRKDFFSGNVMESHPVKHTGEHQQKMYLNIQGEKNTKQSNPKEMNIETPEPGMSSIVAIGETESQKDGNPKDIEVHSVSESSVNSVNKRHVNTPYTADFDKPLQLKVPQVSKGNKTSHCTQDTRISAEKRTATDQGESNTKGNPGASLHDGKKMKQTSQLEEYIQAHTGAHATLHDGKKTRQTYQLQEYIQAHTGTQLHKCTRCEKAFRYKNQMEAHLRTHTEEKPYRCLHCGLVFEFFHSLKEHLNLHIVNYNYLRKSSQGNRVSTHSSHSRMRMPNQKEQGQKHWQEQTAILSARSEDKIYSSHSSPDPQEPPEELPYRCTYCVKAFRQIDHLIVHLRSHTGEKPYKCKHCGEAFKEWRTLKRHADMHKRKPHKCTYCDETFKHLNELKRHSLTHRRKQLNDCSKCGKTFRHLDELQRHAETHRREQPHCCTRCGKTFKRLVEYQMHVWNHTREHAYKCTFCSKRFEKPCYLRAHLRTHTGEKDYKCMVCDRVFSFISVLKAHQRTYTGEEPFKCMQCKKTFSQSYILKEHIQQHREEESPYHCRLCDKPFWLIKTLRKHILKHTGKSTVCPHTFSMDYEHKGQYFYKCKEPFECMHCGRAFEHDIDLKMHFPAHKVNKLRCLLCRKLFRSRKEFIGYYRSFKRNRPYECTYCRANFCFPHNLARHVMLHAKTSKDDESTTASEQQNSADAYTAGGSSDLNTVFIKEEEEYDMDLEMIVKEEHDVEVEGQKMENVRSSRRRMREEETYRQDFYKEQLDVKCVVKKEKMDVV